MTDIKQKALALLNDLRTERGFAPEPELYGSVFLGEALMRAIEQHEAFRKEVSDALEQSRIQDWDAHPILWRFIIPKPKPDPLVEVLEKMGWYIAPNGPTDAENFRAALEARGFEIREKNDD